MIFNYSDQSVPNLEGQATNDFVLRGLLLIPIKQPTEIKRPIQPPLSWCNRNEPDPKSAPSNKPEPNRKRKSKTSNELSGKTPTFSLIICHPGPGGRTCLTKCSKTSGDSGGVKAKTINQTIAVTNVLTNNFKP